MNSLIDSLEQDMEQAKQILADPTQADKNILDVAFDAGYMQIKTFNEHFRKQTGMCPREYRAFHTQFKRVMGMTPQEYRQEHDEETL